MLIDNRHPKPGLSAGRELSQRAAKRLRAANPGKLGTAGKFTGIACLAVLSMIGLIGVIFLLLFMLVAGIILPGVLAHLL